MGGLTVEIIVHSLKEVVPIALLAIGLGLLIAFATYGLMAKVCHSKNALAYARPGFEPRRAQGDSFSERDFAGRVAGVWVG